MSKLNLKKFKCGGCYEIIISNEFTRKCWSCGSTLLEKQEIKAEDLIRFCELELESANHHDYIELPGKLFKKIQPNWARKDDELAKIIAEEFYNNI